MSATIAEITAASDRLKAHREKGEQGGGYYYSQGLLRCCCSQCHDDREFVAEALPDLLLHVKDLAARERVVGFEHL
jgi:hypothetical protein